MVLIGISVKPEDKEQIKKTAERRGLTISAYMRSIVLEEVRKEEQTINTKQ